MEDRRWTMVRRAPIVHRPSSIVHRPSPFTSGSSLNVAVRRTRWNHRPVGSSAGNHHADGRRSAWGSPSRGEQRVAHELEARLFRRALDAERGAAAPRRPCARVRAPATAARSRRVSRAAACAPSASPRAPGAAPGLRVRPGRVPRAAAPARPRSVRRQVLQAAFQRTDSLRGSARRAAPPASRSPPPRCPRASEGPAPCAAARPRAPGSSAGARWPPRIAAGGGTTPRAGRVRGSGPDRTRPKSPRTRAAAFPAGGRRSASGG